MKLYELPPAFAAIIDAAEDGCLTDEQVEQIDALEMQLSAKLEACCRALKNLTAIGDAAASEASRLKRLSAAAYADADRLKVYMKSQLERMGMTKAAAGLFNVRIQKNPLSISFDGDATTLPRIYQRVTIEPDKAAMLEAFKEGWTLPEGATVTQGTHLRIS